MDGEGERVGRVDGGEAGTDGSLKKLHNNFTKSRSYGAYRDNVLFILTLVANKNVGLSMVELLGPSRKKHRDQRILLVER